MRYRLNHRSREMGLGSCRLVSLREARDLVFEASRLARQGIDPITQRLADRQAAKLIGVRSKTFNDCADEYLQRHKASWSNPAHAKQWPSSLDTYVRPVSGPIPIEDITTNNILSIIEPVWLTKTETASRVRGRIEKIIDAARAAGYSTAENPARWRGHLDQLLPAKTKTRAVQHMAAMPYSELPVFGAELEAMGGFAPIALRFLILTASRTNEVLGAVWNEFDLEACLWTIPAERMKARRAHRVPLSEPAMAIIRMMANGRTSEMVFPGLGGRQMSPNTLLQVLKRAKRNDVTVHGFRSTFRQWCAEQTDTAREVAEAALAHTNQDRVEAAYQRSDLLAKRASLMKKWSMHVHNN
jgi:integrase